MPRAYYNEHDPKAAVWLRELIAADQVPPGVVDERDIREVQASDLAGFTQVHLFAGIGVWGFALRAAGWPDSAPVITGSPPCQPFSSAGLGHGTSDSRHLWPKMRDLLSELDFDDVFMEQVSSKAGLAWWDEVAFDAQMMGYIPSAFDLPAAAIGAPHIRQRLYVHLSRANSATERHPRLEASFDRPDTPGHLVYKQTWKSRETPAGAKIPALRATGYRAGGPTIFDAIKPHGWATTTARDGSRGSLPPRPDDTGVPLDQMATLAGYPTPAMRDWKDSPGMATAALNPDGSARSRLDMTPRVAALAGWPTTNTPYRSLEGGQSRPDSHILTGRRMDGSKVQVGLHDAGFLAAWGTPMANHANGDPEAFLERKRRSVSRGSAMGVALTDLNMQAKAWAPGPYRAIFDGTLFPSHPATDSLGALDPAHSRWMMGLPPEWDEAAFRAFGVEAPAEPICEPSRWDSDWLYCRDGKWRPVAPWSFPLAVASPARVPRLKGYGNAIVGPLAAEFIKASGVKHA